MVVVVLLLMFVCVSNCRLVLVLFSLCLLSFGCGLRLGFAGVYAGVA